MSAVGTLSSRCFHDARMDALSRRIVSYRPLPRVPGLDTGEKDAKTRLAIQAGAPVLPFVLMASFSHRGGRGLGREKMFDEIHRLRASSADMGGDSFAIVQEIDPSLLRFRDDSTLGTLHLDKDETIVDDEQKIGQSRHESHDGVFSLLSVARRPGRVWDGSVWDASEAQILDECDLLLLFRFEEKI